MNEERIIDLEIKLAHQEVIIEDLRQALDEHHEIIEMLKKDQKELKEKLQTLIQGEEIGPHSQRPPHY